MAPTVSPPPVSECTVTFPTPHILVVTIARAKSMNSLTHAQHWQLDALFNWYDNEPSLRAAIITGQGTKAFCSGSDLIELHQEQDAKRSTNDVTKSKPWDHIHPPNGFAGVSRRRGKKPIIAAVNGLALGGGFEIVLGCDIVLASPTAFFGLPEARVGLYAYGGGLPRLVRLVGIQAASDIALTCRRVSAREALSLNLVSTISKTPESLLDEAIAKAQEIAGISPDSIIVTKQGLREALETASVERAFQITHETWYERLMAEENSSEGLEAFKTKRKPRWRDAKL